jgi:hypothetical protein
MWSAILLQGIIKWEMCNPCNLEGSSSLPLKTTVTFTKWTADNEHFNFKGYKIDLKKAKSYMSSHIINDVIRAFNSENRFRLVSVGLLFGAALLYVITSVFAPDGCDSTDNSRAVDMFSCQSRRLQNIVSWRWNFCSAFFRRMKKCRVDVTTWSSVWTAAIRCYFIRSLHQTSWLNKTIVPTWLRVSPVSSVVNIPTTFLGWKSTPNVYTCVWGSSTGARFDRLLQALLGYGSAWHECHTNDIRTRFRLFIGRKPNAEGNCLSKFQWI